jgi:hypothetical protein
MVGDTFRRRFRERDARTLEVFAPPGGMSRCGWAYTVQYSKPTKVVVTAAL